MNNTTQQAGKTKSGSRYNSVSRGSKKFLENLGGYYNLQQAADAVKLSFNSMRNYTSRHGVLHLPFRKIWVYDYPGHKGRYMVMINKKILMRWYKYIYLRKRAKAGRPRKAVKS